MLCCFFARITGKLTCKTPSTYFAVIFAVRSGARDSGFPTNYFYIETLTGKRCRGTIGKPFLILLKKDYNFKHV
jgi:hypothetical protein